VYFGEELVIRIRLSVLRGTSLYRRAEYQSDVDVRNGEG
jgi:hypothetical protein